MKYLVVLTLIFSFVTDPGKIGKVNTVKAEAKKAYMSGQYDVAAERYRYLIDSLAVNEEEVRLNLANAYFHANDTLSALSNYQALAQSTKPYIRSRSQHQLGVMANRTGKLEEALSHFKQAIKADPANTDARYNYEMVKKKLEEKKKQEEEQKDQNKDNKDNKDDKKEKNEQDKDKDKNEKNDKDKSDQQDEKKDNEKEKNEKDKNKKDEKDDKSKDQQNEEEDESSDEKKEIPPSVSEKLKEMKISEEKARMILEAMKNQEVQYLQQNKRKATQPKDRTKPDW